MHRRPTLKQREGLLSTTRYILYGNRVRVIRQSPLSRDDQYIPLAAIDPDRLVVRKPSVRLIGLAGLLALPGLLAVLGWPRPLSAGLTVATVGLSLLGVASVGARGWPGRVYVRHGSLQLLADAPDAATFRHFEAHLIAATRDHLVRSGVQQPGEESISIATEIRRLHAHCREGHLPVDMFQRHKLKLIRSIAELVR
jgi:hypothetical protein